MRILENIFLSIYIHVHLLRNLLYILLLECYKKPHLKSPLQNQPDLEEKFFLSDAVCQCRHTFRLHYLYMIHTCAIYPLQKIDLIKRTTLQRHDNIQMQNVYALELHSVQIFL